MAKVNVTLSASGTGEHGTMTSEDGQFTDIAIEHADWIVDPGLTDQDDLICIDGWYENGDDEFYYEIYLRPWGVYWDDVDEDSRPRSYDDWYLPLVKAGKSMPNAIGADAPASSGDTKSTAPSSNSNAPGGTGLVSEEAVQKGYVWMNEVNNNIFDSTYEDLVDYFGVEGEFVKEEYSDHMKWNQRYYKCCLLYTSLSCAANSWAHFYTAAPFAYGFPQRVVFAHCVSVTVKAEGGWTDMVTKDRHLGEQQLALRWRSLFLMCAN